MPLATTIPGSALAGALLLGLALACSRKALTLPRHQVVAVFWLLLGAALVCFRWPLISLPHDLYPDESQMLAGAITLRADWLFWRVVDVGTAGPLDCYLLLPATFFSGTAAYAAARVTGALLVWATLVVTAETLVVVTDRAWTRAAAVPALLFAAFTTSPEYIHFSTELPANLLVATGLWLTVLQQRHPSRRRLWIAGLVLGLVPWAKLQLVPLAAVVALFLLGGEIAAGRRQHVVGLVIAGLLPTLLVFALVTATGQTENLVAPYILQNLLYVQTGRQSLLLVAQQQAAQAVTNGYLALWLAGAVIFGAVALALARRPLPRPLLRLLAGASILLAVAFVCILTPGRPYPHYLTLLLVPVTLLLGLILALPATDGEASPPRRQAWLFVALLVLPLGLLRLWPRADPYAYYNLEATAPRPGHHQLVAKIREYARPGETLGVWGWRSSLFVETGLRQATRQSHTLALLITGPAQEYYLRQYYEMSVAATPPVFVDAAGPGNFYFDQRRMGHELFPRFATWLASHYTLVDDLDGARLYVRNDRLPAPAR